MACPLFCNGLGRACLFCLLPSVVFGYNISFGHFGKAPALGTSKACFKSMQRKRYLFNCLKDPRRVTRLVPGWWRNHIERNPGDLAYEYAVMNALATDENVEFIPTGYYNFYGFSPSEIERINETCTAFVCPLADVFSDSFLYLVKNLTKLVQRLRIPCIVPCVGLRAEEGFWSGRSPDFDETVGDFVRAVLDKSAIIGLRGETTGRYLEKLGFVKGRDFRVIGCPTLYTYGAELPKRAITAPSKKYPDDDIRAWSFNSLTTKGRMYVALACEHTIKQCGNIKGRIVKKARSILRGNLK